MSLKETKEKTHSRNTPGERRSQAKTEAELGVARPQAKEPPASPGEEHSPLEPSEGTQPRRPLILGIWPLDLRENKFVLLEASQCVGICYGGHRKSLRLCSQVAGVQIAFTSL